MLASYFLPHYLWQFTMLAYSVIIPEAYICVIIVYNETSYDATIIDRNCDDDGFIIQATSSFSEVQQPTVSEGF